MSGQDTQKILKEQDVAELRKERLEMRKKREQKERLLSGAILVGGMVLIVGSFFVGATSVIRHFLKPDVIGAEVAESEGTLLAQNFVVKNIKVTEKPEFDVQLLTPNEYSRPQLATETIMNIVVHYTANPGTTAQQNRDFFEGLKDSHLTSVSSHFVVGLEGEIIQCIPTSERAYASNQRNFDTISIECCHIDETGKFNDATYESVVKLCAYLCTKFNLEAEAVIRHYDVTGKACPKYFVENEEEWEKFIMAVDTYMKGNSKEVSKQEHDSFYDMGQPTVTP